MKKICIVLVTSMSFTLFSMEQEKVADPEVHFNFSKKTVYTDTEINTFLDYIRDNAQILTEKIESSETIESHLSIVMKKNKETIKDLLQDPLFGDFVYDNPRVIPLICQYTHENTPTSIQQATLDLSFTALMKSTIPIVSMGGFRSEQQREELLNVITIVAGWLTPLKDALLKDEIAAHNKIKLLECRIGRIRQIINEDPRPTKYRRIN